MQASGFTNAPVTRVVLLVLVVTSILATATDTKHYLPLIPSVHLLPASLAPYSSSYSSSMSHGTQYFRLATWQFAYINSAELLFACLTLYNLRIIERLWGSRKFASFLALCALYTAFVPPFLLSMLALVVPADTARTSIYLPPGPTAILFALLAQYHAAVPYTYRYKLATSSTHNLQPSRDGDREPEEPGILLTSKSTSYLLPLQLALSQAPWSLLPAIVGWCVGYAWRAELLPGCGWRLPVGGIFGGASNIGGTSGAQRRRDSEMNALRGRMRAEQSGASAQ